MPSSTRARTRPSSTSRSSTLTAGAWRTVVDRAVVTRLGEGLEATGEIGAEPLDRTAQAIGEMADEARSLDVRAIVVVGTAGLRMASNQAEVVERLRARVGTLARSDLGRGRGPARLPRGRDRYRARRRGDRRLRHRRRKLAVHVRSRCRSSTRGSASTWARSGSPSSSGWRTRCRRTSSPTPWRRSLRSSAASTGDERPAGSRGDGRCRDEPGSGEARPDHLRSGRRPGDGPGPRRDRPPDRALPRPGRRWAAGDPRAAAGPRRGDPRRRVHRPDHHGQARLRRGHRQRPRTAARRAPRALRARACRRATEQALGSVRPGRRVGAGVELGLHRPEDVAVDAVGPEARRTRRPA